MCSGYSQFFSDYLLKYFFVFLQLFYHSVYFIECLYPGPVDERAADPGAEPGGGGPHQVTAGSGGTAFYRHQVHFLAGNSWLTCLFGNC